MNIRPDYLRILEIFLNYEKINNKHIVRISHFMDEFNSIFLGNEDAESVLLEMYALDLIKLVDVDHIFGEGGMLLLEKGWEILKAQRNMELGSMKANDIEELIKRIATIKDKGHKEAFIVTLTEMVKHL